ncbi:hypothetical protein NC651_023413 [Populus alba x Populus x berolinensis]|nr:hypothetical protein NC651_023413 [Populus alba x Populus x berolinensis]
MGVHKIFTCGGSSPRKEVGSDFESSAQFQVVALTACAALLIVFCTVWPQIHYTCWSWWWHGKWHLIFNQLPITGNVKKYNKEVEQQQLQHSGFGKVVIKAPGSKKRIQRKGNALFDRSLF